MIAIVAGVGAWYFMGGEEEPTNGGPTNGDGDGNGGADTRVIRIGSPVSLTGFQASFGQALSWGHQTAIDDINENGGLYVEEYGKKLPVEYIRYNDKSEPTKASTLASDLILQDKVDVLVQGCMPPVTVNPISTTADRFGVPFVGGGPWEPWWAGGPYEYAWSILFRIGTPGIGETGYKITDVFFGFTNKYREETNGTVGVWAADDADGRGWFALFPSALEDQGYEVIGADKSQGLIPPGTTDYSSLIREWKNANVEILWGNGPGPMFGTMWRQCKEMGFRPKICIAARAALYHEDITAWGGDLPQGVGVEVWWGPERPAEYFPGIGDRTPRGLYDEWAEETDKALNRNIAFGYAAVQVVADAIQRAGTLDKDKVNQAIAETDMLAITGQIKFSEQHDSQTPLTFGQWIKTEEGEWECPVVFSQHDHIPATHNPIFPLPSLD